MRFLALHQRTHKLLPSRQVLSQSDEGLVSQLLDGPCEFL
jgi:hypothetical protein